MELRAPDTGTLTRQAWSFKRRQRGAPPVCGAWVGMGLLRHDGEVESVVVEDDAVLELDVRGRARYAQAHVPKRRCHHHVPRVLQSWLLRHGELVGLVCSTLDFFEESHHRGAHSSAG